MAFEKGGSKLLKLLNNYLPTSVSMNRYTTFRVCLRKDKKVTITLKSENIKLSYS